MAQKKRPGPGPRKRPSRPRRKKRSPAAAALKVCVVVLLLAALGGGGYYVVTNFLSAKPAQGGEEEGRLSGARGIDREDPLANAAALDKKRRAGVVPRASLGAPTTRNTAPAVETVVETEPIPADAAPVVDQGAMDRAADALAQAKALYDKRRFADARAMLDEALALPGLSAERLREVSLLHSRAEVMSRVTSTPREEVTEKLWVSVMRVGGGKIVGRLKRVGADDKPEFRVRVGKSAWVKVQEKSIRAVKYLSPDDVKGMLKKRFDSKRRLYERMGGGDPVRLYRLARIGVENHQDEEALNLLEQAFAADGEAALTILVQDDADYRMYQYYQSLGDAGRMREYALLLRERYPAATFLDSVEHELASFDTAEVSIKEMHAKVDKEVEVVRLAEEEEKKEARSAGVSVAPEEKKSPEQLRAEKSTNADEVLALARKLRKEGYNYEISARPSNDNFREQLKSAIHTYEKSRDLYFRAIELGVEDQDAVEEEVAEVMKGMFWCSKRLPVF